MVREAQRADILEIKKLIDWAATEHRILPRTEDELRSVIHNFFVWIEGNSIVGCCSLEVYNQKLAEIRSLVVSHTHRNKGIGKALVQACLKKAKTLNIYEVLTITERDAFFEKMGFHKYLSGQWALFMRP